MAHVITRPCCNDASCVSVCPVNCIHPTPDEPEFLTAEALYIDPETCIDCGACIDECPVEAIVPDDQLTEKDEPYLQINADYYKDHDVEGGLVPPRKAPQLPADKELHVAIVGAGPAAFYAAEELVRKPTIKVDMFDRLPTPYGLVRAGVAPDHAATKGVERTFASVAAKKNFDYFLNVEVGKHISHDELVARYHAVIYAVGAATDKRLGIEGEDLRNSVAATQFVAWYNGHPDVPADAFHLDAERVVVVGNGNVALDVARILVSDPDALASTTIAPHALDALRTSKVREVVVLGRRGPEHAAYTRPELLALTHLASAELVVDDHDPRIGAAIDAAGPRAHPAALRGVRRERVDWSLPPDAGRRIVLRFHSAPVALIGETAVSGVRVTGSTGEVEIPAGVVMRAIGYRGSAQPDLPFDEASGTVPHAAGRVAGVPGAYVVGWIKRGPSGGIGTNRRCSAETVATLLDDVVTGRLRVAALSSRRRTIPLRRGAKN